MDLTALVDRVVTDHHDRLRREVPRFTARMEALGSPKALTEPWRQMLEVLLPHLDMEEQTLFPMIRAVAAGHDPGGEGPEAIVHRMRYEHDVFVTRETCVRAAAHLAGDEEGALLDLLDDLEDHTRTEEDELFPQALLAWTALVAARGTAVPAPVVPGASPASEPAVGPMAFVDPPGLRVIRHPRGRCPTCVTDVPARVVRDATEARLEKLCPTHGVTAQVLSRAPDDWEKLDTLYFRMNPESYPQRDYIVRMTEKCNLDCPICLAKANTEPTPDLGLDRLKELLQGRRGIKIDLMAAEPTLREDIEEWVRTVKAAGCIAALHTNGLKLANREFAQKMKDAGVDEVFLQFDGQDDAANVVLRGRPLNKARMAALKNLRELGIATSLIVVIARGVNEAEVSRTVEFAMQPENRFIREVFFLGLRMLGNARQAVNKDGSPLGDAMMMPDEIVDLLHAQRPEVTREAVRHFNELYFAVLSAFHVKKCLYVQHYMMVREEGGGGKPIGSCLDLPALARAAERYADSVDAHPAVARAGLLASIARQGFTRKTLPLVADFARLERLFASGMNLTDVPDRFLLLGFITACDPHNFDSAVAVNCGKGELSADGGFVESGAVANVCREARFDAGGR
jgi:molybdenum cofactor biosynthesis enzyme MoaA